MKLLMTLFLLFGMTASAATQYTPTGVHIPTTVPLNPCLVGGWPMDEGTGTVFHDVSGNANDVTLNSAGAVTWGSHSGFSGSTPKWNTGSFYGLSANASLTNFSGSTPFAIAAWVDTSGGANLFQGAIVDTFNGSFKGWALNVGFSGNPAPEVWIINTNPSNRIDVNARVIGQPTPTYIVMTYDGSQTAGGTQLYVQGTLPTQFVVNNTLSASAATGLAARLGAWDAGGTAGATGVMADLAIYNCALTPTQITTYTARGPRVN